LIECVEKHGLGSVTGAIGQPVLTSIYRSLWRYPVLGWSAKFSRLRKGARSWLPTFLRVSPIIYAGLLATGAGALREQIVIGTHKRAASGLAQGVSR
jgi:hypothetical protein